MDAQNQLRRNTDAQGHSSGLQGLVLREQGHSCCSDATAAAAASGMAVAKPMLFTERCLPFSPFLHKGEILFGFLLAKTGAM